MAFGSSLLRLVCTPAAQIFFSPRLGSKALLSCPSSTDREDAKYCTVRPSLRRANLAGQPSVNRFPQNMLRARVVDAVVDVEVENAVPRGRETAGAALQGSFESVAAVGRVECNSRGCRPIFDDALEPVAFRDGWLAHDDTPDVLASRTAVFHGSRSGGLDIGRKTHLPKEFAEFLNEMWMENGSAEKYFEFAVRSNPLDSKLLCEYACFSWKTLNNADKAEELYKQALEVAPEDADVMASYALFLWQSDL
uniref:Uncharacterized protein n=1 Tax=Physcomitrium patens TaxID=3218 RepID=A0A2K1J4Q3_PHYPA|nr:hypothetical protein PHYPA_022357 [Physcomitrium patens]